MTSGKVNLCKSLCRLITLPSDTYLRNGVSIHIFIDDMQRNFILTDVMKTGDHLSYERFIDYNTMEGQKFDYTGEYYTLHGFDLDSYDRRFAFIDSQIHNDRMIGNQAYKDDLARRLELLHQQGFVFIKACPWESQENIDTNTFLAGKPMPEVDIPYPYMTWTGGVSWFWYYMYDKHHANSLKFTHRHKTHDFLYLNKGARAHRVKLYDKLLSTGVLDNSIHTFIERVPPRRLDKKYELPGIDPADYPRWGKDQDIYEPPYNDTACSLVSETNDSNNEVFMTEKIWKPIMAQHPFVVHGNHLYLQKLKEIGFKTFGSYFDETYDLEQDQDKRIDKIVNLCKDLLSINWQDLYLQTQSLRQHNYNTLFDKDKMSKEINKTLDLFLEFADSSQVPS